VSGYDLTFSAPKSASVLFALGGEDAARRVLAAHDDAVAGALRYVERHALSARRGAGEAREVVPTTGMVAAAFTHGVNRNLDPHLHTHVVMANLVHGEDGRWSACDQRGLWAHKLAAGSVYESHLRAGLSAAIGVRWGESPGLRAEMQGVSPLLLGEFSSRAADIRRHMTVWGSHPGRGARVAWAATRPPKAPAPSFGELRAEWGRRAHAVGAPGAELRVGLGHGAGIGIGPRPALQEHRYRATLSRTADGAARRRDVVAGLGMAAVTGADASTLERLTDLWIPPNRDVGVAEEVHALRGVVPGDHLIAALGPRPVDATEHAVWQRGARAIEAYRGQWGVRRSAEPLGVAPDCQLSSLPPARLADHLRTARAVDEARQRLGWREPRAMERHR
jgi:conjugative relaxase-like TrwC/TraI family protein